METPKGISKACEKEASDALFWADKYASEIINRKTYLYSDKEYVLPKHPTVKTSSSLSGVLHIGRLTDIIRGEAVHRALQKQGIDSTLIYVAEDMDPLRKIPKGVPESYREYIGMPVTDIPDPFGCHKTYAEHHVQEFFNIFSDFVEEEPTKYSMREEYIKGNFDDSIKNVLDNTAHVREIINGFKSEPLAPDWTPYQVVCENCGKIMTTKVTGYNPETGKVAYKCVDYDFKKEKALGCGYEGEVEPKGKNGKLVWKSEWACQWKRWDVVAEGAGKEYIVPNSAFFVNAHICEDVVGYPAITPIFYEYITIGGGDKMSASVGNVVYPKDWLRIAPPEALRLLFLKRITKTRDFKWDDVPRLLDELDEIERVYYGLKDGGSATEHIKCLYEAALPHAPAKEYLARAPYSICSLAWQVGGGNLEHANEVLLRLGYTPNERTDALLPLAGTWGKEHGDAITIQKEIPKEAFALSPSQKKALEDIAGLLGQKNSWEAKEFAKGMFGIAKENDLKPPELFKSVYITLLGKDRGPKAAAFILSLEPEFAKNRLLLKE